MDLGVGTFFLCFFVLLTTIFLWEDLNMPSGSHLDIGPISDAFDYMILLSLYLSIFFPLMFFIAPALQLMRRCIQIIVGVVALSIVSVATGFASNP